MTGTPEPAQTIPGLELPAPASSTQLETAVRSTLEHLRAAGSLTEVDAARCVLAVRMAQIIEVKARTGRTSTVSNDGRLLKEILDDLAPAAGESGVDEELRQAMREWAETT